MNKVRWGIIGSGGIARKRTLPGMILARNAECLAVMDLKEEGAEGGRGRKTYFAGKAHGSYL